MNIIKTYSIKKLDTYFFTSCQILISILAIISTVSIFLSWNPEIVIPTILIFVTPLFFISISKFRDNIFSVLLIFFLIIYVYIPLTYISILGEDYNFGWGLASVPFSQEFYAARYLTNLYFLFLCIFSTFLGLSIFSPQFRIFSNENSLQSFGVWPIFLLGIIAVTILVNDITTSHAAIRAGKSGSEGLIKFLFFDHAYLFISGVALIAVTTLDTNHKMKKTLILLIAFAFIGAFMLAGMKAGWLSLGILFLFLPYCYLRNNRTSFILFPSIYIIVSMCVLAPVIYFATYFYRFAISSSFEFDVLTILSLLDSNSLGILLEEIFYRLSAGGFDRFMLISTTFLTDGFSSYGIQEYLPYMIKNFINLILPGTIYLEAYAPSSQMFPQVIQQVQMDGDVSASYLLSSINSQPYTIFGVMTVIGGWFAPLIIFLYNLVFSIMYAFFKNLFIRMTLIYLYWTALNSFGFEVALGYAYHLIISLFFMYFFLLLLSKLKIIKLPVKSF